MLRPYQVDGLKSISAKFAKGVRRQLVSMPTGSGKTVLFANVPTLPGVPAGQMLVLAHREELLEQAAAKIAHWNPGLSVSIEQGDRYADPSADILISSVATLGRKVSKRRERFNWDNINVCIVDEAHHATASTYKTILEAGGFLADNPNKLLVGVTATPNRSDGTPLADIFEEIVYHYSLRQAITDGWLCDLTAIRVDTRASLDWVRTTAGDFNLKDLAEAVNTSQRNKIITQAWRENAVNRQTIVFCVDIQHSVDMAAMFQAIGVKAEAVWGDDPQRAEKLSRHNAGETQVLCNCAVLTEGYDSPIVACVVLARPTKSSLLYQQMIGRGTRLFDNKPNCLIMDCFDQTGRHSLSSLPSLLGMPAELNLRGQSAIATIKALENVEREYPHINLDELRDITKLQEFIQTVNLWDVKFTPEVETNSKLSWHRGLNDGYVLMLPDKEQLTIHQNMLGKFEVTGTLSGKEISGTRDTLEAAFKSCDITVAKRTPQHLSLLQRSAKWHSGPATEKQMATLRKLYRGQPVPTNLSKGDAHRLIGQKIAMFKKRA